MIEKKYNQKKYKKIFESLNYKILLPNLCFLMISSSFYIAQGQELGNEQVIDNQQNQNIYEIISAIANGKDIGNIDQTTYNDIVQALEEKAKLKTGKLGTQLDNFLLKWSKQNNRPVPSEKAITISEDTSHIFTLNQAILQEELYQGHQRPKAKHSDIINSIPNSSTKAIILHHTGTEISKNQSFLEHIRKINKTKIENTDLKQSTPGAPYHAYILPNNRGHDTNDYKSHIVEGYRNPIHDNDPSKAFIDPAKGAHASTNNKGSFGIAIVGKFSYDDQREYNLDENDPMVKELVELTTFILTRPENKLKYTVDSQGNIENIYAIPILNHNDLNTTKCPGNIHVNGQDLKDYVYKASIANIKQKLQNHLQGKKI